MKWVYAMYLNFRVSKYSVVAVVLIITVICFSVIYSGFYPGSSQSTASISSKSDTRGVELPIVMYHSMLKDTKLQGQFVIDPAKFEEDLKYLKDNGYTTITASDLIDYVYNNKELPKKPIMLTFDDGYYNNYLYAYPLLKKYKCKAVISPIVYYSDLYSKSTDAPSPSYSHCTWKQLKEMQNSGCVEIQNHSYNMHSQNGRLGIKQKKGESSEEYKEVITQDISKAQNRFKEKLEYTPQAFVYPFGALSDSSEEAIKALSFKASFTCEEKINIIAKDKNSLYLLGRFIRTNKMTTKELFNKFH